MTQSIAFLQPTDTGAQYFKYTIGDKDPELGEVYNILHRGKSKDLELEEQIIISFSSSEGKPVALSLFNFVLLFKINEA